MSADPQALSLLPEESLRHVVDLLVRLVEAAGALVIFLGAVLAVGRFVLIGLRTRNAEAFVPVRLGLGRFLELGLEFQLAGDVLRTAIAPSFRQIGQLAAIAAIRTALNYFLAREIGEERQQLQAEGTGGRDRAGTASGDPSPEDNLGFEAQRGAST